MSLRHLLLILWMGWCLAPASSLLAQQQRIVDSLEQVAASAPNDSLRMETYMDILDYLSRVDNEQRGAYARKVLALAEPKDPALRAQKIYALARAYALRNLHLYYYDRSDYNEALRYAYDCLAEYEQVHYPRGEGAMLSCIANVYRMQGQGDQAGAYYLRSKDAYQSVNFVKGVRSVLINYGEMLFSQGRSQEALNYYLEAEKTLTPKDRNNAGVLFLNIGAVYNKLDRNEEAYSYLEKARIEYEAFGHQADLPSLYSNWGDLDLKTGHYEQALSNYQQALNIALETQNKTAVSTAYNQLAKFHLETAKQAVSLYTKDSLYSKALEYNRFAKIYDDSIFNNERSRQLAELQVQYETEKKVREISQLSAEATTRQIALLSKEVELRQRRLEADRAREQSLLLEKTNANQRLELEVKEANLREQAAARHQQEQEIAALNQENARRQAETRRERTLSLGLAIGLGVLALFIFLLARLFWQRTLANRAVTAQNREIERQRQAIAEQNRRLEEAGRYKSDFLSNMSHEIRTPLNTVINVSALLAETPLDEQQRAYADAVRHASQNLLLLVNDLLDFSKIEAGKIELRREPVHLPALLRRQVDTLRFNLGSKPVQLHLEVAPEVPPFILADAGRLQQILLNLLGNALKFTEQGSVTLACAIAAAPDSSDISKMSAELAVDELATAPVLLEFSVRDTGIGIPPERLAHIFDAFTQADEDTHLRYGGTGLGLTITRQLVELQGGALLAESTPGVGSIFRFTLPATLSEAPLEADIPKQNLPAEKLPTCRLLLVEDNLFNQMLARELLEKLIENPTIILANNGAEALEKTDTDAPFDLILMDVRMPVMDGFAATRALRERGFKRPIIALTANATTEEEQKCRTAGMNDYVSKPIDRAVLREKIRRWTSQ